jgi:hypothetical protein
VIGVSNNERSREVANRLVGRKKLLHQWHDQLLVDEVDKIINDSGNKFLSRAHFFEQAVRWYIKFLRKSAIKEELETREFEREFGIKP